MKNLSFTEKMDKLKRFGFSGNRVGMSNDKYSFMYYQIDELTDEQFDEFISVVAKERLEELRTKIREERISYSELHELQTLAKYIDAGDVELLEAAGVPENHNR